MVASRHRAIACIATPSTIGNECNAIIILTVFLFFRKTNISHKTNISPHQVINCKCIVLQNALIPCMCIMADIMLSFKELCT